MAYNYLSDFIVNTRQCGFKPVKAELIQSVRDNRVNGFKYFEVEIPKIGEIKEIPAFLLSYMEQIINGQGVFTDRIDKMCVPILNFSSRINRQVTTYPAFIKNWLSFYGSSKQVTIIKLKDDIYYTFPGVLMDANFKILIYLSMDVLTVAENTDCNILIKESLNCYVSPEVFTSSTVMCRNLVKKFIPEFITITRYLTNSGADYKHNLIIKDRDNLLLSPVAPTSFDVTEESYFALEQGTRNILNNVEYV